MIYMLERLKEYHLNWDEDNLPVKKKKPASKKKQEETMEEIKEEFEEPDKEEAEESTKNETIPEKKESTDELSNPEDESKEPPTPEHPQPEANESSNEDGLKIPKIDTNKHETLIEGTAKNLIEETKEESVEGKFFHGLLEGLSLHNYRIYPVSDNVEKISGKKKFQGFFDVVVNGFLQAVTLKSPAINKLLKPDAVIYQENC